MQRIFPKTQTTAFVRKGELQLLPSISELGQGPTSTLILIIIPKYSPHY